MQSITRLDAVSARKISAGQVITDLSSVLKELLENALDAEATQVTIRLEKFGMQKIEVEDDGTGVPFGEEAVRVLLANQEREKKKGESLTLEEEEKVASLIPLLHCRATTKRSSVTEVDSTPPLLGSSSETIDASPTTTLSPGNCSLGFRGEALHSLAQLAHVTLSSMHPSTVPYTVELTHGPSQRSTEAGGGGGPSTSSPHLRVRLTQQRQTTGTTVTVEKLFGHLPVRLRELQKSYRKQLQQAVLLVKQYAVSHPNVRVLLLHQEDPSKQSAWVTLVSLSGSRDLVKSVSEAYGGAAVQHLHPVQWNCPPFGEVTGLLADLPLGGRLSKDRQVLTLDGRLVDLPSVHKALQDAFQQCLPNASQKLQVSFFLNLQTSRPPPLNPHSQEEEGGGKRQGSNCINETLTLYDVNLTPNKRKVLFADVEKLAHILHGYAMQDFQRAAERSETGKSAREHQRAVESQQIDKEAKERRVPVSVTAFTRFTFKTPTEVETVAGGAAPLEWAVEHHLVSTKEAEEVLTSQAVGRISALLYDDEGEEEGEGRKRNEKRPRKDEEEEGSEEEEVWQTATKMEAQLNLSEEEEETTSSSSATADSGKKREHDVNKVGEKENSTELNDITPNKEQDESAVEIKKEEGEEEAIEVVFDTPVSARTSGQCGTDVVLPFMEEILHGQTRKGDSNNNNNKAVHLVDLPPPFSCCGQCQEQEGEEEKKKKKKASTTAERKKVQSIQEQDEKALTALFEKRSFKNMKIIGQFNLGFILATLPVENITTTGKKEELLFIIDQHASDEIYNYERHCAAYKAHPQILVSPAEVAMDVSEVELALEHADLLKKHGFLVKRKTVAEGTSSLATSTENKLLVCSVPVLPYDTVLPTDVVELIQQLLAYNTIHTPLRAVWHSLATKACRQSIMIGTALSRSTMEQIVHRLATLEKPWNCPHGRPTLRYLGTVDRLTESLSEHYQQALLQASRLLPPAATASHHSSTGNEEGEERQETERMSLSAYYYDL